MGDAIGTIRRIASAFFAGSACKWLIKVAALLSGVLLCPGLSVQWRFFRGKKQDGRGKCRQIAGAIIW